jgi:hypothetical protein
MSVSDVNGSYTNLKADHSLGLSGWLPLLLCTCSSSPSFILFKNLLAVLLMPFRWRVHLLGSLSQLD